MTTLIFTVIAAAIGVALLFVGPKAHLKRAYAAVPLALAALLFLASVTTIIEAKNVGVVTAFGKPVGTLEPGLSFKAPWQKVTELDGTKITNRYEGQTRLPVRIGDGTTAHVSAAIRWSIVGEKADDIYADYRSDDVNANVRESLVETVFGNAINQVFGTYNPTADLRVVNPGEDTTEQVVNFVPDYDGLVAQVTSSMEERVEATGGYVKIDFITISGIDLSETTQKKINEFQAEVAKTQVALQQKATNEAIAAANNVLAESLTNKAVLVARCLDTQQNMVDLGQQIPAGGLDCWGSGGKDMILAGNTPATR